MSRKILIDGQQVNVPGVYSTMDASALSKKSPAGRGVIAILAELAMCWEPGTAHIFTGQGPMKRYMTTRDSVLLGGLAFSPANDKDRIPNGAARVVIIPVNPATRAGLTANNVDGAAVRFDAALYGLYGNAIQGKIENGTTAGKKVTVVKGTVTEVADNIGDLDTFKLEYNNSEAPDPVDFVKCSVDPNATGATPVVAVTYSFTKTGGVSAFDPRAYMAFDGPVTLTFLDQGGAKVATIKGINKSTGVEVTETINIADDETTKTTSTSFSEVSEINISGMLASAVAFTGTAFSLTSAGYATLQSVVDRINTFTARGFTATLMTGESSLAVTNFDKVTIQTVSGAGGYTFTADLYHLIKMAPKYITLATLTRSASATGLPSNITTTNFSGGSTGTASASDWQDALDTLKTIQVNTVVPMSSDSAIWAKVKDHCIYMAGRGRDERNSFFGIPDNTSLTSLRAYTAALNTQFSALAIQNIDVYNEAGELETLPPVYQALQLAGMNAGRTNRVSIVNAVPNIYGFSDASDGTWDSEDDKETLIDLATTFYATSVETGTYYTVIDNTTYLTDDNPIWGSITATEDAMISTKNVRRAVEFFIGQKNFAGTRVDVEAEIDKELSRQVREEEIRAYKRETIQVEDLGNGFNGDWEEAVAEPLLFIHLTPHFTRFTSQ